MSRPYRVRSREERLEWLFARQQQRIARQPTDALPYQPVVINAPDGTTATLPNVRQCFCTQCGVVFVTSK